MPGDITIGSGTSWWGPNLTAYVENGTIPESRIDDMAERILAAWYLLGQDNDYPPGAFFGYSLESKEAHPRYLMLLNGTVSFDMYDPLNPALNPRVDVQEDHYKIVREVAAAGTVLLKNVGNALPLRAPTAIAVIGTLVLL